MRSMEGSVREVLYETRYHASRPYSPNYPPRHQQLNDGAKGSFLSLFSTRGVSQLREKWSEYTHTPKLRKLTSLFISPRGERVAIAAGNQVTILRKDNDYREPCGLFTGSELATFSCGTWSEAHDILGITDDTDTIYFVKANGEEITRVTKRHLKVSSPIIGLILLDDSDIKQSCLSTFSILTADGSLHDIEISQDPSASISLACTSSNGSILNKQFPQDVCCFNYNQQVSLLAVVSNASGISLASSGNAGSCITLWRRSRNLDLEPVISTKFEGLFSKPKGYVGQLTSPKVLFSPSGKFIGTLDLRSCLVIFEVDEEHSSLLKLSYGERYGSQVSGDLSSGESLPLNDIVDFTWWSDSTLTVARRSGAVTMLDTLTGIRLLRNDPVYSMPILERVQHLPGHIFLLESSSTSGESCESSSEKAALNLHMVEQVSVDKYNQFEIAKFNWTLISFSEKSVREMFDVLIGEKKYEAALEFADHHRLDRDEVLKAQWLHSKQGLDEIDTFLSKIKDQSFVLSECVNRIGPTEAAVRALLAYGFRLTNRYTFSGSEDESRKIWEFRLARLKLLQFRDMLETFLGINMGRFSVQEYSKFRTSPINEVAVVLAESGKIGALNLLFKRHPYSLTPFIMEVLGAIPETIPVQTYGQLLPGTSPPGSLALREEDWVECEKMVTFINTLPETEDRIQIRTEPIVKMSLGILWPAVNDLSTWYKKRAKDIDMLSGQLDNCLCLVDFAIRKGIYELEHFREDISYLHQLIYSDGGDDETNFTMSLIAWEQLLDYEKFKMILKGVGEENVLQRLRDKAIPFMRNRFGGVGDGMMDDSCIADQMCGSFLVRWLKEISLENKVDICLMVIEEGCKELQRNGFFVDEAEAVNCALQCIYSYSVTDRWHDMASMLSMLPQLPDSEFADLKKRLKHAEGHIEAGRLLAFYQVPKPISFFMEAHSDSKGVKQILRLMLSKFIRRQPSRSDNDWANMWHDLQSLQEKGFPFLDLEYLLMEFCRGLLKAGKFSLARNYLKGVGSIALATDKAENLVIQAAREYFFSASSLACSEIWKAKECLNIFPSSRNVTAEADIIDAVTIKLPNLGVNLLPVQFRQIKDPMEIIKLAITNQGGAYVNVDELIEIAKLLGLSSHDDISAVQEAIAREAAVAGDLQLAFDLCLVLAKKGHGAIWDLCAALARGPALENMDISSRKQLIGFALSHCDEESIGELLHAWKDLDMQGQCEKLMMLTRTNPPNMSVYHSTQDLVDSGNWTGQVEDICDNEVYFNTIKGLLSDVAKNISAENGSDWESLRENGKVLSFAALWLPWLTKLTQEAERSKKVYTSSALGMQHMSVRTQAIVTTLSWLANNGFAPRDDLIASLAKSIIEPPVTEVEDILGSFFLLNLVDAFHGVEIIEEQVRTREDYSEICSIMNVGMIYSLLHNSGAECEGPTQRRELIQRKFRERNTSLSSDERDMIDRAQSSFWREWKLKLEEQKRVADHTRVLEQIIPGVETARFLSGDTSYMESSILSLIDSVKLEKKPILKDLYKLASTYGLDRTKVLLQYLGSVLVSEVWAIDDIMDEISEFKDNISACAAEAIKALSFSVYPAIDGQDKQRLAYIYSLLSDCYLQLEKTKEFSPIIDPNSVHVSTLGLARFYKIIEQECTRVSFIKDLNFKNIAGLQGLNFDCFSSEVYAQIDENSVEALAKMVQKLAGIYGDPVPEGLVSWQNVYKHYVLNLLTNLESRGKTETPFQGPENLHSFISELEQIYSTCRSYIIQLAFPDIFYIMKKFFTGILPSNDCMDSESWDSTWRDCLIVLLSFWLRLAEDMQEFKSRESSEEKFSPKCLMLCLKAFVSLVMVGEVSPSQGWGTVVGYVKYGLAGGVSVEIFIFCRAMVFSGCQFKAIADVFTEVMSQFPPGSISVNDTDNIVDLPHLYSSILEYVLQDLASGIHEHKNLHHLLSSLSKLEGDLEDLKRVRHTVWEKMTKFSNNLQLPSRARVYALEVMQLIAATGRTSKAFSAELEANVVPWEGWDSSQSTTGNSDSVDNHGVPNVTDAPNRFETTLVALKSSQLASVISQSIEVSANDLSTVESAVSCFLKLSGAAISESHFDALLAILREWEGIFTSRRDEAAAAAPSEASDAANNWSNDDWDEGWESFQEETVEKEPKKENTPSVHPLHVCWVEIFKTLVLHSRCRYVIKLIDQSIPKTTGTLVDEEGACSLSQVVMDVDCFAALKIALLLPYDAIQVQCLNVVEEKLKLEGTPDIICGDHELLVLLLSSGIMSNIITSSSYGTTFSYVCCMVGNLCRECQEAQLLSLKQRGANEPEKDGEEGILLLFRRMIFPCFISQLVKADQQVLAGVLVTKFMHTNASLSLLSVAEASLRRFLEAQLEVLQGEEGFGSKFRNSSESLVNTISSLRERLELMFRSALASLSTSVR